MKRGLEARLVVELESGFRLEVDIDVEPGRTVALLGPNGAGKSTLVAALSGLLTIDEGHITIAGRVVTDAARGINLPPEDRGIGVVFQEYILFPHLSVADNVAFGLTARGTARGEARRQARDFLSELHLSELQDRLPAELSGGQAQRVALARALIIQPDLLLLDEPLAALDVRTRADLRHTLSEHLAAFSGPRILITHDPTEAFLLADEVFVMEDGLITQRGTAADIRLRPQTKYAADLAGSNLLMGQACDGVISVGSHELAVADTEINGSVLATIHPRAISLHRREPEGSPRNAWETVIERIEHYGDRVRVQLGDPVPLTAEVTPRAETALELSAAEPVWVSIKATEIFVAEE